MRYAEHGRLAELLEQLGTSYGDFPAFQYRGRTFTYQQLCSIVETKVQDYAAMGVEESSAIGVLADDPAEFITDVFAILRLDAFVVLLAAETTSWELDRLFESVDFSGVLSARPLGSGSSCPVNARQFTRTRRKCESSIRGPAVGYITSGTTGAPRLAIRSLSAVLVEAVSLRTELELQPGARMAIVVPFHHSYGFDVGVVTGLLAGMRLFGYPLMPPSAYLAEFSQAAIEIVPLVSPQLRLLANACTKPIFSRLRVICAGVPLDAGTQKLAYERLGCKILQMYGTTETGTISITKWGDRYTSVGRPCHHIQVRLDPLPSQYEGSEAGNEGVVAVSSAALFDGYVAGGSVDPSSIESGWFSTGDCARLVDGEIELSGRLSCAINIAGVKVSPEEVESALLEFPAVQKVLVVAIEDALAHQRMKAYVTPATVDVEALRRFCESRLSASKRPHYYQAVAELSATASGKVLRRADVGGNSGDAVKE